MTKEEFCPACLVAPVAFLGAGAAAGGSAMAKRKWKRRITLATIIISIVSLAVLAYFLFGKKSCAQCQIN